MSDDEDDDLFADSGGDTDDLIAESKAKPIAKPKKLTKKKAAAAPKKRKRAEKIPDADKDSDDDGPGLFDSDDEDDEPKKPLSKRERMEALRKKRQQESAPTDASGKKKDGYESEDSANSADYVRTKEDDDFIDREGDDQDAINELYSEQIFDDEEAEEERPNKKKKIKGAGSSSKRSEAASLGNSEADKDNPIMQAVNKMKKKKKATKHFSQLVEEDAKPLLEKMLEAADEDDEALERKKPAMKKLAMLNEVCEKLANRELMRPLLEHELLSVCKRWIQPLPNGQLGNVTVRQRLLHSISQMTGENGIGKDDLQRSGFGKVVMSLYMHKDETPAMKRQCRALIDQWSRPIFQKSGNMRDLERVHSSRGGSGISAISKQNQPTANRHNESLNQTSASRGGKDQDLNSLIKSGSLGKTQSGINRVRIPFSRGFNYSARPTNKTEGVVDKRRQGTGPESRQALSKRILEKKRPKGKNQRSANISIEGRSAKP